jgi:uncharacterized protein YndB with AHSA1/START domain/ribosomal protein S18 acetylase RimI-like enzyme
VPYPDRMPELAHHAEIEVAAPPDQVWRAIIDPQITRRYFYGCEIEGEWLPGTPWRYHARGQTAVEGTVLEAQPPHLLRLTAHDLWDPGARDDPPFRITWRVEPLADGRSRVQLTFDGFETENASYRNSGGLDGILEGLRLQVDPDAAAALRRLDRIGEVEVRPLGPERLDDYLDLFDNRAFADNPSWRGCYCFNFRFAGDDAAAAARSAADNRRDMSGAIEAGRAHGLLAYVDGRAVGWCSASPKAEMVQLSRRDWMPAESEQVGIVGCLVIAPQYRRHGVARMLVAAAGDYLAGIGCTVVEAYPVKELDGDAHGFYGPLEIYRELGYETYRDLPGRLVVRKQLRR